MIIRSLMFIAFLCFSGISVAQEADTPRPDEIKVFHECLEKGELVFNDKVQCIGKVFEHCVMMYQGQTSTGIRECYVRETSLWEKMVANAEKKLRRNEKQPAWTELVEADRNWKAFRNNACNIPYAMDPEGKRSPVPGLECFNRVTALWALQLSEFATPSGN